MSGWRIGAGAGDGGRIRGGLEVAGELVLDFPVEGLVTVRT